MAANGQSLAVLITIAARLIVSFLDNNVTAIIIARNENFVLHVTYTARQCHGHQLVIEWQLESSRTDSFRIDGIIRSTSYVLITFKRTRLGSQLAIATIDRASSRSEKRRERIGELGS